MDASDTGGLASVVYEYWNSANKWGPVNLLKGDDGYYWFDVDTRDIVANEFLWEGEFSYRVTATDLANGTPLHDPAAVTVKHVTVITSTPAPANEPLTFRVDNFAPVFDRNKTGVETFDVNGDNSLTKSEQSQSGRTAVYRGVLNINASVHDVAGHGAKPDQVAKVNIERAYVRIDGGEWRPMTHYASVADPKTNAISEKFTYRWDASKAQNGAHLVEVQVEDNLGQIVQKKVTVWVDNPDFSSSAALILMLLMVLGVMIPWVVMFHRAKRKQIGKTPPAGFNEHMQQSGGQPPQPGQGQQDWGGQGGNIQW